MQYEETYYGHRVRVTTTKTPDGRWSSCAEVVGEPSGPAFAEETAARTFSSEDEARRAALSTVAGALDRARQHQGKT